MISSITLVLDLLILAFTLGATVWFFFVQTPVLLKWKGKEKFIPIQMKLTKALFKTLALALPVMLGLSFVHGGEHFFLHVLTAGVATFGALMNHFVVVPRALRAGGMALREVRESGDDDRSTADFASRGAGEPSKTWHRLVVVFVVVMLGGMVTHGIVLTSGDEVHQWLSSMHDHHQGSTHAHAHQEPAKPSVSTEPARADEATKRNVKVLHERVRQALEDRHSASDAAPPIRDAFQQIFIECEMTGEAHNRLHHFLVPVGKDLKELESGDPEALQRLDERLASFDRNFR